MNNLIYSVTSNEFTGMCREFTNKAAAIKFARWQKKCGWSGIVRDMRTGAVIF